MTPIGRKPKHEICSMPGWVRWTLLAKERYGDSFSAW